VCPPPLLLSAFAKDKGATFPLLGKIDCGSEKDVSHPLFLFLTSNGAIKWNFTKVGKVVGGAYCLLSAGHTSAVASAHYDILYSGIYTHYPNLSV
jgi:hypothetical protein